MTTAIALDKAALVRELSLLAAGAEEPLRSVVCYALQGGKHARGLLLLAAGQQLPCAPESLLGAAACVELLHAATLVQDDVFDAGSTRRGRAATHIVFGLKLATLAADWMLAEATRCAYRLHVSLGEALTTCAQAMMVGEAREGTAYSADRPHAATMAALRARARAVAVGKTGVLFGLALSAPQLLAGSRHIAEQLRTSGVALGVAFQYLDDTLDLYGEQGAAGKELARDLPARLYTMPVVDALPLLPRAAVAALLRGEPAFAAVHLQSPEVRARILQRAQAQWEQAAATLAALLPAHSAAPALIQVLAQALLRSMLPGPALADQSAA